MYFFSSRRRHTRYWRDWSSDVCSSDLIALEENLKKANLTKEDIGFTVVTGYGRFTFEGADKQISEISCHARGIHFLLPDVRTIIDIGGQDAKAISLDEDRKSTRLNSSHANISYAVF